MTIRRLMPAAIACTLCMVSMHAPSAASEEAVINSDRMERQGTRYQLDGNVSLTRAGETLSAQSAVYDDSSGSVSAEGNLLINGPAYYIEAERGTYDINNGTGTLQGEVLLTFREVEGAEDGYRIEASELEMLGRGRFILKKASLTTCEGLPPDWCVRGSTVDVLVGERIAATNARFKIKGIPMFYTPYLWVPIVTERRSGLLPPRIGYKSSTGMFYSQPLFWAISVNRDATFRLDYHSRDALGEAIEYRYVEGPSAKGEASLFRLHDNITGKDYIETKARHSQEHGQWAGFADINFINREEYFRAFEPYLEDSSSRYNESRAEVAYKIESERQLGNSRAYMAQWHWQDLKPGIDPDDVLQRGPEAGISLAPQGFGPFAVRGLGRVTRWSQRKGTDTDRSDMMLSVAHTAGSGPVLRQEVSGRAAFYESSDSTSYQSGINSYAADLGLMLERNYTGATHSLEPSIRYRYQKTDGSSPRLLNTIETETEQSKASFEIMNRLKNDDGRFLTFRAAQPYDFLTSEKPFMPLALDLWAGQPKGPLSASLSVSYSHYPGRVETASANAGYTTQRLKLSVGESYARAGIESYTASASVKPTGKLELFSSGRYDKEDEGGLEEFRLGATYMSQCWGLRLTYTKRPEDYSYYLEATVLGFGGYGFD